MSLNPNIKKVNRKTLAAAHYLMPLPPILLLLIGRGFFSKSARNAIWMVG